MKPIAPDQWKLEGKGRMTDAQRRMLNAICGVLSEQIIWHGSRLSKDDWRHMLAGTMLGWRMMPGIDRGEGGPGWIMLGGSSLQLTREMATDAIQCGIHIGDCPDEQGLKCRPVTWSPVIYSAMGFNPDDFIAPKDPTWQAA